MASGRAAAVLAAVATAWLAAAQPLPPASPNCTLGDASITCTWTQPATLPISQYRCT